MVKIDRLRDDANKRILKCQEGKNIWYRLWINPEDMMRIEPLLEIGFGWRNLRCIIFSSMRYGIIGGF